MPRRLSWGFLFGCRPQFILQFLNGGQASLQFFGKTFGQRVFGYANGLVDVTERVFGNESFPGPAKDDPDRRACRRWIRHVTLPFAEEQSRADARSAVYSGLTP